jgi:hypothetical protein
MDRRLFTKRNWSQALHVAKSYSADSLKNTAGEPAGSETSISVGSVRFVTRATALQEALEKFVALSM